MCLLTGAPQGLSYTRESEEEGEEETAGVFDFSLLLSVWFSFSRCLSAGLTDCCLQFPLDTLQQASRHPGRAFKLTSPVGLVLMSGILAGM